MDVVLLSRLQFALTIMFHYIFPPLTIGMGMVLVYLEGMHLWKKDPEYHAAARFWTSLFAITFAVGVATGIVMEFQFGTNWAVYSRFVGDVFGSALAAEGIFAFFLESGFLAVLVFGWDKVSPGFHFFSTVMVALGSMFSAVWIVVANSWQQTPAGSHIVQMMRDGEPWFYAGEPVLRAEIVSFWDVVFNPSSVDRLTHTLIGAFIMGAFFIMSISAWYVLRDKHVEFAKRSFTGALLLGASFSLVQLVSGHSNATMIAEHQPAKLAAFEAHYETGPADLSLLGLPNDAKERIDFDISIPGGVSFLVHGNFDEEVAGLDLFRVSDRPPVLWTYLSYHVMVGLGMFFIGVTLLALFLRWRGTLFDKRWLMWVFVAAVVGAMAANQLGWISAELGRQPWVVYPSVVRNADGSIALDEEGYALLARVGEGVPGGAERIAGLRTEDAVSETVGPGEVLGSMIMFGLVYALLGALWLFVLKGPLPAGSGAPGSPRGFRDASRERLGHEKHARAEGEA